MIFLALFLCGCQKQERLSSRLTQEERKDLEYFFRHVMVHDSGAFVLFGSKPLCDSAFFDYVVEKKNSPYLRNPHKGWQAWEKIQKTLPAERRFLLVKEPIVMPLIWPDGKREEKQFQHIILVDVQKTALVFGENYEFFKNYFERDFHPIEVAFDVENPDSFFWNRFFGYKKKDKTNQNRVQAQIANGLLFGFGKKNTLYFSWMDEFFKQEGKIANYLRKAYFPGSLGDHEQNDDLTIEKLFIPGYRTLEDDETTERYRREVKKIQKIYRWGDFLEITLQRLAST